MRASRDEWAKRVERWRDSGLSAEQFAAELGYPFGLVRRRRMARVRVDRWHASES